MLIPRSHTWSPAQKRLIVGGIVASLGLLGAGIYFFEHYYGLPSDRVFVGTWCMSDDSLGFDFNSDHSFQIRSCTTSNVIKRGRWYAGGSNIYLSIVNENDDAIDEIRRPVIFHIIDIEPDSLRLAGPDGIAETYRRVAVHASNQALQPTADRLENF